MNADAKAWALAMNRCLQAASRILRGIMTLRVAEGAVAAAAVAAVVVGGAGAVVVETAGILAACYR